MANNSIIVDTREQRPYWRGQAYVSTKLLVGDYTTNDLLGTYHVERKTLTDLYGTLTRGHARFRREVDRAKVAGITLVVVVEGTKAALRSGAYPGARHHKIPGTTILKIVATFSRRYQINFIWCKNRAAAKRKTLTLLTP